MDNENNTQSCSCGCSHKPAEGPADALLQYRLSRLRYLRVFCLFAAVLWPVVAIIMKLNLAWAAVISGLALLGFLVATLKMSFIKAMSDSNKASDVQR